jgi:hypothetical protein
LTTPLSLAAVVAVRDPVVVVVLEVFCLQALRLLAARRCRSLWELVELVLQALAA